MLTRIITGLVLAPLVVLLFIAGPDWLKAVVIIVAAGICLAELYAMALPGHALERWVGVALGVGLLTVLWRSPPGQAFGLAAAGLAIPAVVVVLRPLPIETAALRLFALWGGLIYIVLPLYAALELALAPDPWMLYVGASVWIGDTAAYFTGRAFGRHKLHPKVSPNKTIEGAIGGLVGSALGGFAMVKILDLPLALAPALLYSVAGGAIAQMGDLAESLIKRSCGVKDSGTLLPGHGGLLDRIDALIVALPFFALVLVLY
ncbi:MAG: phosphatidate cytidylyltransferase [Myxococcota bacterium]